MTNEELKAENERLTRHLAGLKESCDMLVQAFGALAKATPDVRLRPTLDRAVSHAKRTLKAIELAATPNEPPPEVVEAGLRMLEAIQGAQGEHREMEQSLYRVSQIRHELEDGITAAAKELDLPVTRDRLIPVRDLDGNTSQRPHAEPAPSAELLKSIVAQSKERAKKLEEAHAAALYYGEHHVLCKCDRETKSKVHSLCSCGFSEFLCGFGLNEFARVYVDVAQRHLEYGAGMRAIIKQAEELGVKVEEFGVKAK